MTNKRRHGGSMAAHEDPLTVRRIGPDRVLIRGDRLVIESPVDMEYWEVRTYRHTMIGFAGRSWRIVRTGTGANNAFRYELEPWAPSPTELTGPKCDYGPAFVERRDREYANHRRRHAVSVCLTLVLPLIGVLGSDTKRRIEERYAIRAIAATRASLYVEAIMVLASATLLAIGSMVTALGYPAPWPLGPRGVGPATRPAVPLRPSDMRGAVPAGLLPVGVAAQDEVPLKRREIEHDQSIDTHWRALAVRGESPA